MSEGLLAELIADAGDRMHKAVDAIKHEMGTVRTGRASPALLDRVMVDYYGAQTPLKQLATINAPEARLITVTPFDKSSMNTIEKSIRNSDLGLNPSNDGNILRLTIPELTEERRRELVKQARHIGEEGRISIRNVRRDVMQDLRELKNESEIGEDDERRAEAELQKLTDEKIAELDGILKSKEAEILEV
jgi:ribosome recycling factor